MRYSPMLCQMGNKSLLRDKSFLFELKLDGTRIVLYKDGKNLRMINRRGNSKLEQYPELKELYKQINAKSAVLDGELIIYDKKGMPNFNLLQRREQLSNKILIDIRSKEFPATLVVFDILEKDGESLVNLPIEERKKILSNTIKENKNIQIIFSTKDGMKLWNKVRKLNLEGVIIKQIKSRYEPGVRSKYWLKLKNLKTADVVIVGYLTEIRNISSFCMAVYKRDKLVYIGRVGTGFTEDFLNELYPKLKKLKVSKPPVINPSKNENITWIKPFYVAEIEYLEMTRWKELRAPSFKRLRFDKIPKDCNWEGQFFAKAKGYVK